MDKASPQSSLVSRHLTKFSLANIDSINLSIGCNLVMKGTATTPRSAHTPRPNASHSRTYLTHHNYRGPQLLRIIDRRSNCSPAPHGASQEFQSAKMTVSEDEDVMALPISSDEEESSLQKNANHSNTPVSRKRKAEEVGDIAPSKRQAKIQSDGVRKSKRTAQNAEPTSLSVPDSSPAIPDFLSSSQSSQQRKRKAQYGKTTTYNRSNSQATSFADPGELPSTPRKARVGSFKAPSEMPASRKRTPRKKVKEIDIPSSAEKPQVNVTSFAVPDDFEDPPKSSSTSTQPSHVFDTDQSPSATTRKRSSSTSSLSSVDSIASYELSQKQKDDITSGTQPLDPVPKGCIRCPLCQHAVDITKSSQKDPTDLPLRKQQIFCHAHRVKDAHIEWATRGYPTIDWHMLDQKRIAHHAPHLRQILYRKHPSFYIDALESAIRDCRGNKRRIQRYLANEVVELVKPGYYGPRGAKVMANKITALMSNHLKRSLKTDETVRAVGVAGFVSAVLLPELLLQIVKEDMGIVADDEARRVVGDSTEVGMLLWPDDDHVILQDDDK